MGRILEGDVKLDDLINQRFGRLVITGKSSKRDKYGAVFWICDCDCGKKNILVRGKSLKNGSTKSCGCLHNERLKQINKSRKIVNTYDLSGDYGIGYTSKGEEFYFDLEDYDKIKDYCWRINDKGYVVTSETDTNRDVKMHRVVLNINNPEIFIDHIYHKNNDNRKSQLRLTNNQENCMNGSLRKNNKSGVIGVHWNNKYSEWRATIGYKNKYTIIGAFSNKDDAIRARLLEEKRLFKEYAPQKELFEKYGV